MHPSVKKTYITLFALSSMLLAGCSLDEPSNQQIKTVMQTKIDTDLNNFSQLWGAKLPVESFKSTIDSVEKIGCKAAEGGAGVLCTVKITSASAFGGKSTKTQDVRFVKSKSGWEWME